MLSWEDFASLSYALNACKSELVASSALAVERISDDSIAEVTWKPLRLFD